MASRVALRARAIISILVLLSAALVVEAGRRWTTP
jgi:hypothetical protein